MELVKSLTLNLSLLVSLSFISSLIYEKFYNKVKLHILLQIMLFCILVFLSTSNPVIIAKEFNFDGRTVLISISTLFFGWNVGIPTAIVSIFVRMMLSDVDIYSTISAAILPFLLGLIFNILRKKKLFDITTANLLIFGLLNSLSIFLLFFILRPVNVNTLLEIQRAAILVFPIVTTFVGLIINSGISKTILIKKVQESESQWRATINSINEGLIILDTNGKIMNLNNRIKDLFDIKDFDNKTDVLLNDFLEIKDFENKNRLDIKINKDFSLPDFKINVEKKVTIHCNGKEIPAIIYLTNITNKNEEVIGYVFVIRDISQELEAQAKIISSEQTFKGVFNSIQEAIYIQDINGIFIDVNDGAVRMYGYERQDFIGNSPAFLSAEFKNDNLDLNTILNKAYNSEPQIFEFWGKKKDGRVFPKIVSLYSGVYFGQKVIIAIAIDISNIKIAQEKLFEHENLLRTLINATPDIIYVKDGYGNWNEFNKGILELLGVDEEVLLNNGNSYLFDKLNDLSRSILMDLEKIEEKTWLKKSIIRTEISNRFSNGYIRYFDIVSIPLFNDDGSKKNIILIGRDITLKKKEELEKQIVLNKMSSIIENFEGGILLEDQFGKIEFINDNFIKLFKLKQNKTTIQHLELDNLFVSINNDLIQSENFLNTIRDCKKNKVSKYGLQFYTKDGRIIELSFSTISHKSDIVNYLWIFKDITLSKTYENKLKSQISELERFNKSMVERELRMIELKKEVNDLLLKAGFPPKYLIID